MTFEHLLVDTYVHMPPAHMLTDLSEEDALRRPGNAPHSVAELVAHLNFWQGWYLKRCRGKAEPMVAAAVTGWPAVEAGAWEDLREQFLAGLKEAAEIPDVDRRVDPAIEFPPLAEYSVRDALVHVAMHNSHHLGQVVLVRQMLGLWPPPSGSWTW